MLEWILRGEEAAVEVLVRRLARDASSIDQDLLLAELAAGLKFRGYTKLAAFTNTFAYMSTRESWYRFGGSKALFAEALKLDSELAWSTFADELAAQVARGGGSGITTRLVQLLVAGDRIDEAFSTWHEACGVIGSRLPPTGPADGIDIEYDASSDDASMMVAAVVITRMNHLFVHEKRAATAAAAILVRYGWQAFSSAFAFAVANRVPPWTLITLLQVLFEFEVDPYEATRAAAKTIGSLAVGELVSGRVLARALLRRAGLPVPAAPLRGLPISPNLSSERASELTRLMGRRRIERINRAWPEFGRHAVEQMDVALRSEGLERQMRGALDRFRLGRKGRIMPLWYPLEEEVERVFQTTGSSARFALAREGIVGTQVEDEIGVLLLGDVGTLVRLALSRCVRPAYAETLRSCADRVQICEPVIVDSGEFIGWVVAEFSESESKVTTRDSVEMRVVASSGVVFQASTSNDDNLPFAHGDPQTWTSEYRPEIPRGPLEGPISALQQIADPFGNAPILIPHPIVLAASGLSPVPFEGGLTLVDPDGEPAVVCRTWRQCLIGDDYFDDREHRIEGIHLLIRRDVFDAASRLAPASPQSVTLAVEHH